MIEIDGSLYEGGGQIIRTSIGLSALTGKPVKIFNIRAKRRSPGLKAQHLGGIKAVAEICSGTLTGATLGSSEIGFMPGEIKPKPITVSIATAGSVGLVFQSIKLPASRAGGTVVDVRGGATFGKFAPPLPFTQNVLIPILSGMGFSAGVKITRHGFYPSGGARVSISFRPHSALTPLKLSNQGNVTRLRGLSVTSNNLRVARVAERQAETASKLLTDAGYQPDIDVQYVDSDCPGSGIVLWAETDTGCILGLDGLGEKGKPADSVGREAAEGLLATLKTGATVDERLSDQLLPFFALIKGKSEILSPRLTQHAKTNMWVIEQFLKTSFRTEEAGACVRISCSGSLDR